LGVIHICKIHICKLPKINRLAGDWLWIKKIWKCGIFFVTLGCGGRVMLWELGPE
jgi:hypothetical protein